MSLLNPNISLSVHSGTSEATVILFFICIRRLKSIQPVNGFLVSFTAFNSQPVTIKRVLTRFFQHNSQEQTGLGPATKVRWVADLWTRLRVRLLRNFKHNLLCNHLISCRMISAHINSLLAFLNTFFKPPLFKIYSWKHNVQNPAK